MGNAAAKREAEEMRRIREASEAAFQAAKVPGGSRPSTASKEEEPPKKEIDWDNIVAPPEPKPKKKPDADARAMAKVGKKDKIMSVSQMKWKHSEIEEVTVFDAMAKHDAQEQKFVQALEEEKELDEKERKEAEEEERRRRQAALAEKEAEERAARLAAREAGEFIAEGDDFDDGPDPWEEEQHMLEDLHEASAGEGGAWDNDDGWGGPQDVSHWHGVTCGEPWKHVENKPGFVLHVRLERNGLGGSLALDGWGRLKHLTILSLSHNGLEGPVPPALGELGATLQVLNLSCNRLAGEIPSELRKLSKLTHLWLSANQLTGPALPDKLASATGATSLVSVRAKRNALEGRLPTGLGALTALTELDLEENALTGPLPASLTDLSRLASLRLANNRLTGALPVHYLDAMRRLKDLRLYHNALDTHTASKHGIVMRTVSHRTQRP